MELALYHPEHGYYVSGHARVGKQGDFYTSVSIGRIYGRLLASICREVWECLGCPPEFTIIEQGANDGTMAVDMLETIRGWDEFHHAARFLIIEPFALNRSRQQERLKEFPGITWVSSPEELPEFTGIHLSNELLDAFPVDALRWNGIAWEEECVRLEGDLPVREFRPIKDPKLSLATRHLPMTLPEGWRLEVNRSIAPWLAEISSRMRRGLVLTVDYGQSGDDRYEAHRADGTLLAYANHRRFDDPLPEPGLRDITAQVDFTDLAGKALKEGFGLVGYTDQHHFLVGAAEPWMRGMGDLTAVTDAAKTDLRSLQKLLNPALMGRQFKAIGLGKDFPAEPLLSCFRYQRPGVEVLLEAS